MSGWSSEKSFLAGVRRILPFRREPRVAPVAPPEPDIAPEDREKIRALGFFCGALTRGGELYAESGAGAAAFALCARLPAHPQSRADLRESFAQACLDGAHIKHLRELDAFINASTLADGELARELTNALRIALAQERRAGGFVYESGTARAIAIHRHLLSLVRRAPDVFATLAGLDGQKLDLRAIEHRLLDERLDQAERQKARKATPAPRTSAEAAEVAHRLGLEKHLTPEAIQMARRMFAARHHPDRAPAHRRDQANRDLAHVNAALDELARSLG